MVEVENQVGSYEEDFKPLYIEEASARLERMTGELLSLEERPGDTSLVEGLFRDAHTLKSGATMVGFAGFAAVAHRLEDFLKDLHTRKAAPNAAMVDGLLKAFTALAEAIRNGDDAGAPAILALPLLAAGAIPTTPAIPATQPTLPAPAATPAAAPHLDDTLALIDEASAAQAALGQLFSDPQAIPAYRRLTLRLRQLQDAALASRMVAVGSLYPFWRRGLREIAQQAHKEVRWQASGDEVLLDRAVLEQLRDPVLQIIRNAVIHGVEDDRAAAGKPAVASIGVNTQRLGSTVAISISDDGHGISLDKVRASAARSGIDTQDLSDREVQDLVFRPGFSTAESLTQAAGRGIGLDIVATSLGSLHGHVSLQTSPAGTTFTLAVPATLAVVPCTLVEVGSQQFGIPRSGLTPADACPPATPASLGDLLGLPRGDGTVSLTVNDSESCLPISVDAVRGDREVIVRPLRGPLPAISTLAGVGLNPDGSILVILDPAGLVAHARSHAQVHVCDYARSQVAARGGPLSMPAAPPGLSPHQAHALALVERNGDYQFNGRWRKTIDCLVRKGLVRADYELVRRHGKTVWRITAHRAPHP